MLGLLHLLVLGGETPPRGSIRHFGGACTIRRNPGAKGGAGEKRVGAEAEQLRNDFIPGPPCR